MSIMEISLFSSIFIYSSFISPLLPPFYDENPFVLT